MSASLPVGLSCLLNTPPLSIPLYHLTEPPDWGSFKALEMPTPYRTIREQMIAGPAQAQIAALTAWRRMMWGGATLDGKPIDQVMHDTLNDAKGVIIGDRSPLSMVYQGVYPGSSLPDANHMFPLFYGLGQIPFPDLLYILIPEPEAQRNRLQARIEKVDGRLEDFGDALGFQQKIIEAYNSLLGIIGNWPGVYRLNSQEVKSPHFINISTAISLHLFVSLLEKGVYNKEDLEYTDYQGPFRLEVESSHFKAYCFSNLFEAGIGGSTLFVIPQSDRDQMISNRESIIYNYGDILLILDGRTAILITIENPNKISSKEAIQTSLEAYRQGRGILVTSDTRLGNLHRGQQPERAWRNITW
jgi:hypothetical protein